MNSTILNFSSPDPTKPDLPETCDDGWTPWSSFSYPGPDGEFETTENIRQYLYLCPKHYIKEVECRYVQSRAAVDSHVQCDVDGAVCRNNGKRTEVNLHGSLNITIINVSFGSTEDIFYVISKFIKGKSNKKLRAEKFTSC